MKQVSPEDGPHDCGDDPDWTSERVKLNRSSPAIIVRNEEETKGNTEKPYQYEEEPKYWADGRPKHTLIKGGDAQCRLTLKSAEEEGLGEAV